MDIGTISLILLIGMLVLLAIGMPLGFASGFLAVVVMVLKFEPTLLTDPFVHGADFASWTMGEGTLTRRFGSGPMNILAQRLYGITTNYVLVSVPLFIFMATLLERSGIARDMYSCLQQWMSRTRGGIAVVTAIMAIVMAAMSGIIGGEVVLLGLIALPQMLRLGYDKRLAIGTITAGGSLGTMIPPSIILIFYGLTAEVSISHLFLATLVPGLMLAGLYIGYILVRCGLDPAMGPPLSPEERDMPLSAKLRLFGGVALPMLVAGGVLVSIYAGFASITESAALGAFGAAVAAWARGTFSLAMLREVLVQALRTCGMVFWLVFGTNALIGVYNLMGGIAFARGVLGGVSDEPAVILSVMIGVFILLGLLIDWIGILFLTMPIFLPTLTSLGYDPIWFGIVFNLSMQIAYLTPPFGPACFYLKGAAPEGVTLQDIFAAQWPFIGLQCTGLLVVVLWPDLSLWLPRLVYGGG